MTQTSRYGIWLAFFGTLVLTFDAMLMRLSQMDGLQMTSWRGLCMGMALLLLWLVRSGDHRGDMRHVTTGAGVTIIICQFFNSLLFCLAIAMAPVAVVLFGLASVPVFAAIFAWLLIGERTSALTWIAIVLVMGGISIAVSGKADGAVGFDLATLGGAILGLGVAVVLALNFVILRARPELPIALLIGCGAMISGMMSMLVIGPPAMMQGTILPMVITGAVILPVSFFSLSLASRYTHASNVSLLMLLETVLAPVWVWLVIGEVPTPRMIFGGMIVIASLAGYLILIGRQSRPVDQNKR